MASSGLIKWFDSLFFSHPSSPLEPPSSSASSRRFEETLALRLRSLLPVPCESPGTPIHWLVSALRVLSLTLYDAAAFVASDSIDSDVDYLDSSVALLDACNAVSAEIARMERRQLYLRLALRCLTPDEDGHDDDRPKSKLHCARKAIAEWENIPSREIGRYAGELIHRMAPRCVESAAITEHGVTYAAEEVSRLVMEAVVVALGGRDGKSQIVEMRVSSDWPWAEAFNQVAAAISDRLGAFLPLELAAAEAEVGKLARRIEREEVGDGVVVTVGRAAEELASALEKLRESVNGAFQAATGTRNALLNGLQARYWS